MPGPALKALDAPANETDVLSAKAALDRIVIPEDTVDRIAQMVSPRSSLIVSDEGPSSETGRGTEFVIVMSDEPQGGLASQATGARYRGQVSNLVAIGFTGVRRLEMRIPLGSSTGSVIGRANWQAPGSFSPCWLTSACNPRQTADFVSGAAYPLVWWRGAIIAT